MFLQTKEIMGERRNLPDYDNPPAVETALGVRFSAIEGWNLFHYGLLLSKFKADYPKQELHPPLGEVTIRMSENAQLADVPVRCWFINRDNTQLLQVQNNFFVRNWRKTEQTPDYLHYDVIKPLFKRDWHKFLEFLKEQKLSPPTVWQCEVSYINHFVRGKDWSDYEHLDALYPAWAGMPVKGMFSRPQMNAFTVSYALPRNEGTLQFASQPGIRKSDGAEIIQLSITASGKPKGSGDSDIMEWLDKGRAAVVLGFSEFTSDETQKSVWRKK